MSGFRRWWSGTGADKYNLGADDPKSRGGTRCLALGTYTSGVKGVLPEGIFLQ